MDEVAFAALLGLLKDLDDDQLSRLDFEVYVQMSENYAREAALTAHTIEGGAPTSYQNIRGE